jgi:hypothetical protein
MTGPFSPDPTYVSLLFEDVKNATDRFVRNPHETARLQMVKSLGKMIASTSDPVQEAYSIAGMVSYTHLLILSVLFADHGCRHILTEQFAAPLRLTFLTRFQ